MPKRKNRKRNKTLDYLVYLGVRLFASVLQMFDRRTNYQTARWLGDALYYFDRKHRRIAIEHLRRSFPDWSEKKYRKVARRSMQSMVCLGMETLYTPHLVRLTRWKEFIRLRNVQELLRLMVLREKGLILLTGHFGNWEVLGYALAAMNFPTYSVARRLDNPYLDEFILGVRQRAGQTILDKRGVSTEVFDLLEQREAVGFVADQDAGRRGMFVDFFGRQASTYKIIALLAVQQEVPVAVGWAARCGWRFEFELGVERIIYPAEWRDRDDPIRWITQEYTRALESAVRRYPEQYLWVHRRWKHRPKGEPAAEGGIA